MPSCSYASWPQGLIVVSAEHPIRAAARLTRRLPGYRFLRRRAVPRIRQSAAARALAQRMFPPTESAASGPPADVAAGRLLAGLGIERLPVILLNLVGLADDLGERVAIGELVDDVIDDVARAAAARGWFPAGVPARRAGLQSGTQLWLRRRACDTSYGLVGRTARLVGVHRCTSCVDDSAVRSLGRDQRRTSRTRRCGPRGAALASGEPRL